MTAPFETGSVYLAARGGTGQDARLVWKKGDKALAVPAGRYWIRNWSIQKEHEGEPWIMSASGPSGPEIEVKEGEDLALDLSTRVQVMARAKRHGKALRVSLGISCGPMGLSVIRNDKLVEIGYRLEGAGGREVAGGSMKYG